MTVRRTPTTFKKRAEKHYLRLFKAYGPIVGGKALRAELGFGSANAFRQAAKFNRLPVPTFFVAFRRGRHARADDIAAWLARIDEQADRAVAPLQKGASHDLGTP